MTNFRALLFTFLACAGAHAQCIPGGLAIVVPIASPTDGLSMAQLRKLVMGDVHTWPDKNKVTLVSTDADGAVFKCLISTAVRMTLPEYRKYLLTSEFRGDEPLRFKTVGSAAMAVRTVAASPGAFSAVEGSSLPALGGLVKVLSINGKRPGEPGYPL
jgi:hypothetical protein